MGSRLLLLPQELFLEIWQYLSPADIALMIRTSKEHARQFTPLLYDVIFSPPAENRLKKDLESRIFARAAGCVGSWQSEFITDYFTQNTTIRKVIFRRRMRDGWSWLHALVLKGNTRLFSLLDPSRKIVCGENCQGDTILHAAVKGGNEDSVMQVLGKGADVLAPDGPKSILAYIPKGCPTSLSRTLIASFKEAGGDISARGLDGQTPLHHASLKGDNELVALLIEHGADVLATNKYDYPPLVTAVLRKRVKTTEILLDAMIRADYDINSPLAPLTNVPAPWAEKHVVEQSRPGQTILHLAVKWVDRAIVKLLLDAGADPVAFSEVDSYGAKTPFEIALLRGWDEDMVQTFIQMKNPPDYWPSHGGIQKGFEESVRQTYTQTLRSLLDLWKLGKIELDINGVKDGKHLIHEAIELYDNSQKALEINETVMHLINAGVDPNVENSEGETPLSCLCGPGNEEARMDLMIFLLAHGADWRRQNDNGLVLLHLIVRYGFHLVIEYIVGTLVSSPKDRQDLRSLRDQKGNTALHVALGIPLGVEPPARWAIIISLLSAGLDPNALNAAGETPALLLLMNWASKEQMEMLSSAGADWSLKDVWGRPLIHWVVDCCWDRYKGGLEGDLVSRSFLTVYDYLLEVGADTHPGCMQCEGFRTTCLAETGDA